MTDEETRAAAWRAHQVQRASYARTQERRLRGSSSARQRLAERWAPLINRTPTTEEPNGY